MLNSIAALYGTGVAASTTAYESIASYTVPSGGTSSVVFGSIPSTYSHLQIRVMGKVNAAATDQIVYQFNGDSGNNYTEHQLVGNGSSASAYGGTGVNAIKSGSMPGTNYASGIFGVHVIDILDYANTNKYKTVRILNGFDGNGSGVIGLYSGLWLSTSAINQITGFINTLTIAQYSSIALYGVK